MSKSKKKTDKQEVDQECEEESYATDEEIGCSYEAIDNLQEYGINAAEVTKLKDAGFATVGQLFQVSQKELLNVKGVSDAKLEKILQAATKVLGEDKNGFVSANCVFQKMMNRIYITTGSKQLDSILGGGLESMSVTEIHGEFRTGKTQLCHSLCVTCQLPRSEGGASGKIAYVDTEGSFRPQRVAEIAKGRYNLDQDEVLDNIIVARFEFEQFAIHNIGYPSTQFCINQSFQPRYANGASEQTGVPFCERGPFRLLIIDSVTALFRCDFRGRGELGERQQKLNNHLNRLVKHAEEFNIAVLLVNQVMADPGAASMFGPISKPIGGHILSHTVHTRVLMKKGRENTRICRLVDSPRMPEAEAMIQLTSGGISDLDD